MRRLKVPLATFGDLPTAAQAGVCFSPDEALIATGTARVPGAPLGGALVCRRPRLLGLLGQSSRLPGFCSGPRSI